MSLKYSKSHNLHCQIEQENGNFMALESLNQWQTYGGAEVASPIKRVSDYLFKRAVERAEREAGRKLHVIPPTRRNYHYVPGDGERDATGEWITDWLPAVTCVGCFGNGGARLTVVWFQDEFGPPIQEPVLSALLSLDWGSLAVSYRDPDDPFPE